MITYERANELLRYDPETGVVRNRVRRANAMPGAEAGNYTNGYRQVQIDGTPYYTHRLCWLLAKGVHPTNEIDHINGVKDDNRLCNLRDVDRATNGRNVCRHTDNSSGITGVCWDKSRGKWYSRIGVGTRNKFLGYFTSKENAIKARKAAEVKYGFHANHGRQANG